MRRWPRAAPRWKPDWRSAPSRNASGRSPAGPTRSASAAVAERQAAARALAGRERRAAGAAGRERRRRGRPDRPGQDRGLSAAAADADRQQAEEAHKGRDGELKAVRARIRDASDELEKVVDSAHGAQIARATRQLQLEQIAGRALEEFATEADVLVAEYGPDVLGPGADEDQLAVAYDREAQERRAQHGAAPARPARQGQPAGARGVRRAGGAARLPGGPARGPEEDPPGPADRDQGSRRAGPAGLQRRRTTTWRASSRRSSAGCSPAATAGSC